MSSAIALSKTTRVPRADDFPLDFTLWVAGMGALLLFWKLSDYTDRKSVPLGHAQIVDHTSAQRNGGADMHRLINATIAATIAAALAAAVLASASTASAQAPARPGSQAWTDLAKLPKEERLAILKREAAREGELVIYSAIGLDRASVWLDGFKAANPGIKVEYLRMTTNEAAQKTLTEFRAGRTTMDLFMSSSVWLGLLSPALALYETTTWN